MRIGSATDVRARPASYRDLIGPRRAAPSEEPKMTRAKSNDHTAHRDGELPPSFDPRCAFAWTLRAAEIACRERDGAERQPNGSNRRGASTRTSLARA